MNIVEEYNKWLEEYSDTYTWEEYYYTFVELHISKSNVQRDYKRNTEINRTTTATKRNNKAMTYETEGLTSSDDELKINSTGNMIYTNEDDETTEVVTDILGETITHIWPLQYAEFSTDTIDLYVDIPNVIYSPDRFSLNEEETGNYRGYIRISKT